MADDNENTLERLSNFLETRQYRVISTRSGSELLQRAPELHPDLMLVDIQMPGMEGLETIRRLRAHPQALLAKTPVIAITALAMPGDRERCLSVGANAYLSKPLKLVQLISLLDEIPLAARLFAIVDVWDALISDRPYRLAMPVAEVLEYIQSQVGKHFDQKVISIFLNLIDQRKNPENFSLPDKTFEAVNYLGFVISRKRSD